MLETLVERLSEIGASWRESGTAKLRVIAIILGSLVVMVAARFIPIEFAQVLVGSLAGFTLFAGLYLFWDAAISIEKREEYDVRGSWELSKRRVFFVVGAIIWIIILVFIEQYVGGPVAGGLTVAVVLCLWRLATATPAEIDMMNEEVEKQEEILLEERSYEQVQTTLEKYGEDRPRRPKKRNQ